MSLGKAYGIARGWATSLPFGGAVIAPVTAVAAGNAKTLLTIVDDASVTVASHKIHRGTSPGFTAGAGNLVTTLAAGTNQYLDSAVTNGTPAYYKSIATVGGIDSPVSNEVAVTPAVIAKKYDLFVVSHSQGAGKGTGTGSTFFQGARAKCYPTKLATWLNSIGIVASSNYISQAYNTAGLNLYDPQVSPMGSWGEGTTGANLGGHNLNCTTGTSPIVFTIADTVDTIVIETPQLTTAGSLTVTIDGGSPVTINQNGTTDDILTSFSVSLAAGHIVSVARVSGNAFVQSVRAYNSTLSNTVRVENWSCSGASTIDFTTSDAPYRAFPAAIKAIQASVTAGRIPIVYISLGGNDLKSAALTVDQFSANMRTMIDAYQGAGAYIVLGTEMPFQITTENTFSQVDERIALGALAVEYGLPYYRGDLVLGSWEAAQANSLTVDSAHWKEPSSDMYGYSLLPFITAARSDAAAKPVPSGAPPVLALSGSTYSVTSNAAFTNTPTSYAYQWTRDDVPIAGATASTYTKVLADTGHVVNLVQYGVNAAGTGQGRRSSNNAPAGTTVAQDIFSGMTDGSALVGRTSTGGGVWAGDSYLAYQGRVYSAINSGIVYLPVVGTANVSVDVSIKVRSGLSSFVVLRHKDASNFVYCGYSSTSGNLVIGKRLAGTSSTLASQAQSFTADQIAAMHVEANGSAVTVSLDGGTVLSFTLTDAVLLTAGNVGFTVGTTGAASTTTGIHFGTSILVTSLG